jgi:hypothetical protein
MYQVLKYLKNMDNLNGLTGLQQLTKFDRMLNDCKEHFFYFFFPLNRELKTSKTLPICGKDASIILVLQDISKDIVYMMQRSPTLGYTGILQGVLSSLWKELVCRVWK